MGNLLAEITRNGRVESVHAGTIVVVDAGGDLVAWSGDPETFAYFRSSAKPFQAVPLVESGAADAFGFTQAELALCCASHHGEPRHQKAVAGMLAKLGLSVDALRCGSSLPIDVDEAARIRAGIVPSSPLHCDCSGKHTGMLATCLHLGYPIDSYLDPDHPLQKEISRVVAEVCRTGSGNLAKATDGCSVPTFGATIRSFATAYSALASPLETATGCGREHAVALDRLRGAMVEFPENVSGHHALVADLMSVSRGTIVAKSGAEGLICLAAPERNLGIAVRIADGSFRSHAAVVLALLPALELLDSNALKTLNERHPATITNHNGWQVGEIRAAFNLTFAGL